MRTPSWLFVCCCLTATPLSTRAQQADVITKSSSPATSASLCLDRIADSALAPVVFYLHASELNEMDSVTAARAADIDLFAQSVALRLRRGLRSDAGAVPPGEPAATWRTRESALRIIVDRDGRFTVHPAPNAYVDPAVLGNAAPSHLLAATLDSIRAEGELFFFANGPADSVAFDLILSDLPVGADGQPLRARWRLGFPVMTLRMPRGTDAKILRGSTPPKYPMRERGLGYEANVITTFIVDTAGHVDSTTMHDVFPPAVPRPTGAAKVAYNAFLDAIVSWLPTTPFEPARLGGCPIRSLARLPLTFGIGRSR